MKVWHFLAFMPLGWRTRMVFFFLANAVDDVTSRKIAVKFEITSGY